jgi:hypothetical protein
VRTVRAWLKSCRALAVLGVLLLAGALAHPQAARAGQVNVCPGGSPGLSAGTACWSNHFGLWIDATDAGVWSAVAGCVGSTIVDGTAMADVNNTSDCDAAGGTSEYEPVSFWATQGLVQCVDEALWISISECGYGGELGNPLGADSAFAAGTGGTSSAPTAFDPSMLDPASITAYFSTGWFIVAMGWVIGKGVSLLVQFIKSV